jgi:peptidoglycan/LPS O-acetylase OafA/YrhL
MPRFCSSDFGFGISDLPSVVSVPSVAQTAVRLKSLNALRFLAALLVFSQHVPAFQSGDGHCGVAFFFILSGFILTYKYQPTLATPRWPEMWRFWINRLARIYPVHLLAFVLFLPYWWPALRVQPATYLAYAERNLTLTHAWSTDRHVYFSYNVPSWSLCNESFFYLCFPALLWMLNQSCRRSWRLPAIVLGLWLLELTYCSCRCDGPNFIWSAYINPSLRLVDFTIGILLGLSFIPQGCGGLRQSFGLASALELIAVAALLLGFYTGHDLPQAVRMGAYFTLPMAAIVFIFAHDAGILSRLLSRQPFQFLGEISFSFFMLHYVSIGLWAKYEIVLGWASCPELLRQSLIITLSLAAAAIVHVIYERPIREGIRARLQRRSTPTAPPVLVFCGRVVLSASQSPVGATDLTRVSARSVRSESGVKSEGFTRPDYLSHSHKC